MKFISLNDKTLFFCLFALVAISVMALFVANKAVTKQTMLELSTQLDAQANLRVDLLKSILSENRAQVNFLHATPPIQGLLRAHHHQGIDPLENTPESLWINRLQIIFYSFALNNETIAQIRYVGRDEDGKELVRVDRKLGNVSVIADTQLQHKSHRSYFKRAMNLQPGEIFFSDINLNRENNKIELPQWGTYRTYKTVFDDHGDPFGFVIINYRAEEIFRQLASNTAKGMHVFLLNNEGNYLLHPNSNRNFLFEFEPTPSWREEYKVKQQKVLNSEVSWALNKQQPTYLLQQRQVFLDENRKLFLIIAFENSHVRSQIRDRMQTVAVSFLVVVGVGILFLLLLWQLAKKNLAVQRAQSHIESIVDHSEDAIFSTDLLGRIVSWNKAAESIFGYNKAMAQRLDFVTLLFAENNRTEIRKLFDQVLEGEKTNPLDTEMKNRKGQQVLASLSLSLIGKTGESKSVSFIVRDVSLYHALQLSLTEKNHELNHKNEELETFIYSITHDLKAPLVTIDGFAKRLEQSLAEKIEDKDFHRLQRIRANVVLMNSIIADLLQLSKVKRQELIRETISLSALISSLLEALEQMLLDAQANVKLELTEDSLYANEVMVRQCLQNLIVNAIKYREPDRPLTILISSSRQAKGVCVKVRDNGIGIDEKYHQSIFNVFERLNVGEGNGVGLSIVKAVMTKHRGEISLESKPGEGSCFVLCFPDV